MGGAHWILQARCPSGIHWNCLPVTSCPQALPRLRAPPRPRSTGGVHRTPLPPAGVQRPTCLTPHSALPNLDLCHLLLAHARKQCQGPFLRIPPTSTYISRHPNSAPKPRGSDKPRYSSSNSSPIYSCALHSSEELQFWTSEIRKTFYIFFSSSVITSPKLIRNSQVESRWVLNPVHCPDPHPWLLQTCILSSPQLTQSGFLWSVCWWCPFSGSPLRAGVAHLTLLGVIPPRGPHTPGHLVRCAALRHSCNRPGCCCPGGSPKRPDGWGTSEGGT